MRSHAKASTAGSTQRQATGLGRILRGALATGGASPRAKGSGAPAAARLVVALLAFAPALITLVALAAPASASQTRVLQETFGSTSQPSFGKPEGLAIDQETGDLLVIDQGTQTLRRYHADGTASNFPALGTNVIDAKLGPGGKPCAEEPASCDVESATVPNGFSFASNGRDVQVAIDESGTATDGDIYVAQGSTDASKKVVNVFASDGKYLGQLTSANGVALGKVCGVGVDAAGALYVGDEAADKVHKYVPQGAPHNPLGNGDWTKSFSEVPEPCALAAGFGPTAGFLFVVKTSGFELFKLDADDGELEYKFPDQSYRMVTVDPANGHVIAGRGSFVMEFDASGSPSATLITQFQGAGAAVVEGLAVDGEAERLYLSRSGNPNVHVFGPLVFVPDSTTTAATNLDETSLTLNGTVDPEGVELTQCVFDYGTTAAYGQTAPCTESPAAIGTGTTPVPVHADISGLSPNTEYHFRLRAANASGSGTLGADETAKTPGPPVITGEREEGVTSSEATLRALVNPETLATSYRFEWGATASYGNSTGDIPLGFTDRTDHPVSVDLQGLTPGATYHWRIVATNENTSVTVGPDNTFTAFRPAVENTGCPNQAFRTGSAALLPDCRAYELVSPIDKNGGDGVAYEYESYGAIGALELSQSSLDGEKLTYATAAAFADSGSHPFVSQYIATRRSGEGWSSEAISPPQRGGIILGSANLENEYQAFSPDLSLAWLRPESALEPLAPGAVKGVLNLYRRDNAAAIYTDMGSTANVLEHCDDPEFVPASLERCHLTFPEMQGYSSDASRAVYRIDNAATPDAFKSVHPWQLYMWAEGQVRLLSVLPSGQAHEGDSSAGTGTEFFGAEFASRGSRLDTVAGAVSEDAGRVYWTAESGNPGPGPLYLRLNGEKAPSAQAHGSATGTGDLSATTAIALTTEGSTSIIYLFANGSFSVGSPISGPGIPVGATIVAVNELGPGEGELTISTPATAGELGEIVSASKTVGNVNTDTGAFAAGQEVKGEGILPGTTISSVGSGTITLSQAPTQAKAGVALEAFSECTEPDKACTIPVSEKVSGGPAQFWTANPDGSRAIFSFTGGPLAGNLYEYDLANNEVSPLAEKAVGVLGSSKNLSYLYFGSEEVLTGAEENSEGDVAQANKPNLYLLHEGTFTFVGTLAAADVTNGLPGHVATNPSPFNQSPAKHAARVTPDGRHIAFVSLASLTGYDNSDAVSGEADRQVFTYGAGGELSCASCNPSGARPEGVELGNPGPWTAAWIPGFQKQLAPLHPLSEDGNRLFFNSFDALVPRDTNGAQDVYEWEAPGSGDCTESNPAYSAQNDGCVSLLSSGESPKDSQFVDASADGEDVFIRTESSFDPRDPGLVDIYDVRAGGGFPLPAEAAPCEGESCQAPSAPPNDATPASATFRGAGNLKQGVRKSRCPKGKRKVRRAGKTRCVKRQRKQKRKEQRADHDRRAQR